MSRRASGRDHAARNANVAGDFPNDMRSRGETRRSDASRPAGVSYRDGARQSPRTCRRSAAPAMREVFETEPTDDG